MSLASQLNANKILEVSNFESANEVNTKSTYELGSVSYSHLIDGSGNFHLQNNSGSVKLLSFDSGNNLLDCATKTHISNNVSSINRTLTTHTTTLASHASSIANHATRLSNVENGSSGLQSLQSVLAVGNNANNQSITGLNELGCTELSANSIITQTVNANSILATESYMGPVGDDGVYKFYVDGVTNVVGSLSNASLDGFSNITQMQNTIDELVEYNNKLKQLVLSLSQSIQLRKPDNSGNFDYTGLI